MPRRSSAPSTPRRSARTAAGGRPQRQAPPEGRQDYKLKQVENRTEVEEGEKPERGLFEATVTFKSAKLVVVKVHVLDEVGSEVSCDGGAAWSLKREP